MIKFLRKLIPHHHPLRLFYHKLWGVAAAIFYRFPGKKLIIIGITGTDGKTTTATMVYHILLAQGIKTGLCSSVEFAIGDRRWKNLSHKTTLGKLKLQKILRQMVLEKCTHAVIETSSHAIKQNRTWGIDYDIVTITNITAEHLDYHQTFSDYQQTKLQLIKNLSQSKLKNIPKTVVINMDDPVHFELINQQNISRKIAYGLNNQADVSAQNINFTTLGSNFDLKIGAVKTKVNLNLPGDFNIHNALAASALSHALDISLKTIKTGLESVPNIPGRMERIDLGQPFEVIIDFAMTPVGYQNLLSFLRKTTKNNLWIVFGCCGDRDQEKRAPLGEIAMTYCDQIIITDDEPYTESPAKIRQMIEAGIIKKGGKLNHNYYLIPDRKEALAFAINNARQNDTIVVPGMGDLEGRTIGDKVEKWSDREVIKTIIQNLLSPSS
jgi:UDP-N-acetylmuramyl-tripeptide synthetase